VSRAPVAALAVLIVAVLAAGCGAQASPLPIDRDLLRHLPAELDGLALLPSDEGVTDAAADPTVAGSIESIAGALYVDPETGDFAFAALMHLRDGAMHDAFLRDWRDAYDEGACSQAGGVASQAETTIRGLEVFVGTCAGGVRTYHAWLGNLGVLVSVSAVGERRLGERLVEALGD
jgi:hypothetical protein